MAEALKKALVECKEEIASTTNKTIQAFYTSLHSHDGSDGIVAFEVVGPLDEAVVEILRMFLHEHGFSLIHREHRGGEDNGREGMFYDYEHVIYNAEMHALPPPGTTRAWYVLNNKRTDYPQMQIANIRKRIVDFVASLQYPGKLKAELQFPDNFCKRKDYMSVFREMQKTLKQDEGISMKLVDPTKRDRVEVQLIATNTLLATFMQENNIK